MSEKVEGSWLCPLGFALRETWNALQRQNGTSLMRSIPPSSAERDASERYDSHISRCAVCCS